MTSRVTVSCRIRKNNNAEDNILVKNDENIQQITLQGLTFHFDKIFWSNSMQHEVFTESIHPIICDALQGYNCTIFTYGQTGSGKTYTMQGKGDGEERGIIFRAADSIFEDIGSRKDKSLTDVRMSCLEIYQERLFDLLSDCDRGSMQSCSNSMLKIRELRGGAVWVDGLLDVSIASSDAFAETFAAALRRRSTGAHAMNAESSRSHLCCTLTIRQRKQRAVPSQGPTSQQGFAEELVCSKVHLIDLAGSEMVRKTDASGSRLQEAKFINKSLSALGNVINALTAPAGPSATPSSAPAVKPAPAVAPHVPFRDSKLTRLLQDSLGGNAKTALILTVSPSRAHSSETLSTLRFGERARQLRTKPVINAVASEASALKALARAEQQILALTATVQELQAALDKSDAKNGYSSSQLCPLCGGLSSNSLPTQTADGYVTGGLLTGSVKGIVPLSNPSPSLEMHLRRRSSRVAVRGVAAAGEVPIDVEDGDVSGDRDDVGRCGVCGLSDEDVERLRKQTGQDLGSFFTCDGNCGCRFHVRCAGVVGASGAWEEPEGEWFCTSCAASSANDVVDPNLLNSSGVLGAGDPNMALVRVLADYHAMRRERNRVLQQWQNEQRVMAALEQQRREAEHKRDLELESLREEADTHKREAKRARSEATNLRAQVEQLVLAAMLADKANAIQASSGSASSSCSSRTGVVASSSSKDISAGSRHSNPTRMSPKAPMTVQSEDVNSSHVAMPSRSRGEQEAEGSSIPRPWLASKRRHPRSSRSRSSEGEGDEGDASYARDRVLSPADKSVSAAIGTGATNRTRSDERRRDLPLLHQCASPADRGIGDSGAPSFNAAETKSSLSDRRSNREESFAVGSNRKDDEDDATVASNEQSPKDESSQSHFLKPLKSRLRDLLKSVQEETGSYVEIRQRMRNREMERSLLKSRQQLPNASASGLFSKEFTGTDLNDGHTDYNSRLDDW